VNPDDYGLIELVLSFGGILAILFWQLYSVKRSKREDARKAEAKKNDVTSGLGQNIAQIKAGREDYLRRVLGKRKIDDTAFDITTVPCFGAVSTAEKWVFTLLSGRTVYCSRALAVIFSRSDAELRSSMYDVIRQVVGILQAQKGAVDANEFTRKRGRIDDNDVE
jgi:hypothetical protein